MRVYTHVLDKTYEAATDLSALQFTFVAPTTGVAGGPSCRVAAVTSGPGALILQNKPTQYKGAVCRIYGFSELYVLGTAVPIVVGDYLKPGAGGKGVKCEAGDAYSAQAYEASSADNDLIEVLCDRGTTVAAP